MTESMLTTRLSSVMVGCGGKETTCSRRSISGRMRSMKGTSRARPGSRVRWKRPSRSTTPALACGTILMPAMATKRTKSSRTTSAMTPPVMTKPLSFGDERRGALDLDDGHAVAWFEDLAVHVGPGRPLLALELDEAGVLGDSVQDE